MPDGGERLYSMQMVGYGPMMEASLRAQGAFVFNAPTDQIARALPVRLSFGVDMVVFGFHFTFTKFYGRFGGIFLAGVPVGIGLGVTPLTMGYLVPATRAPREGAPLEEEEQQEQEQPKNQTVTTSSSS
mmetsp:Transcript_4006/g.6000  ORF Transcript_4006/g.6000 Transcript_4006/m.6000 type:complete len:129 (+) Transcript_4006:459-845(+)|eukprot:CAMPEP_0201552906 /NCGR_PEP_ID=MMETSP0173_2-20130828/19287_1 /ASSEMBLY_ACC=CAM_ASM_000268 /TAXON_ID=218659 /ORGANISM="Vexillifera sp., Strain DIVA3 564/2" /LENGTH=128 /DNA_ID=CAMNT_0047963493 /DNA_START=453 /DNA_END=839 /DNA_ORIENTATION=+